MVAGAVSRTDRRLDAVTDKVSRLRTFLLSRGELHSGIASFLSQATLQELWKDLICRFEWLPDEPDLAQIRDTVVDKLIDIGLRRGITVEDCERASLALYARVEDAAIDPMRPALTQRDFATILDRHALVQVPRSAFTGDHNATAALVRGVGPATGDRTTPTVTVLASLTARFLPPILSERIWRRERLLAPILEFAERYGTLHIQAGNGMGKTMLARQAVETLARPALWADLRDRSDARFAAAVCSELRNVVEECKDPFTVVLDDLDIESGDPRRIEGELSRLAAAIQLRAGILCTISHRPLPSRVAVAIGINTEAVVQVPPFDEAEVASFLNIRGCTDAEQARQLAKIVLLQTSGHVQLVAARVFSLEAEGFPPITGADLLDKPKAVQDVQAEARSLIRASLAEPTRDFLYRLSVVFGTFNRSDALRIADIHPRIPRAGERLDTLAGAWLETPAEGLFRVSPIAVGAGHEMLLPDETMRLHAGIATAIVAERTISTQRFSTALMHATVGKAEGISALLSNLYLKCPSDVKELLSADLTWVPMVGTGSAQLPLEHQYVRLLYRLMQWQIAGRTAPRTLASLAVVIDQEFSALSDALPDRLLRHIYLSHRLIQTSAPLAVSDFVAKLLELSRLTKVLAAEPEVGAVIRIPPEPIFGRQRATAIEAFGVFLSPHMRQPEDIAALSDTLDALDQESRNGFLSAFDDTELGLVFGQPWIGMRAQPDPDYEAFAALLRRVLDVGRKWSQAQWCRSVARQLAIVTDSDLGQRQRAEQILDDAALEWGDAINLADQRAGIAFDHADYEQALDIWEKLIPTWISSHDIQPALSARNAAVSAMYLGRWSEAQGLLDTARSRAATLHRPAWSIGLLADAAHCAWLNSQGLSIKDLARAIDRFGLAIQQLESLPADPSNLGNYFVHKAVTALLLWLARSETALLPAGLREPDPGICSRLDLSSEIVELPPTPTEYAWYALDRIAKQVLESVSADHASSLASVTSWRRYTLQKMSGSHFTFIRFVAQIDATAELVRSGRFEDLLEASLDLMFELMRTRARHRQEIPVYQPDPDDLGLLAMTDSDAAGIMPFLYAGIIAALAVQAPVSEIASAWRHRADAHGSAVMGIADRILGVVLLPRAELERVLVDGTEANDRRNIAAILVSGLGDTGPREALYAHLFAFRAVDTDYIREMAGPPLANLIRRDWCRLVGGSSALLRNPQVHVSEIRAACDAPSTPRQQWAATARILFAAMPAVNLPVPTTLRDQVRPAAGSIHVAG
jgi:hypothetical protein